MKALIGINNKILEVKENDFPVHASLIWIECPENCTTEWAFDGNDFIAPVIPQKTVDEIKQEFNSAIQLYLDSIAKTKLYESSLHCASYVNSTNAQWQAEAQAFIEWRDAVWVEVYSLLSQYEQGEIELGTIADLINQLPPIVWP
ncbi:TPA: hypothetical protein JBL19_06270 [Legionella pneumophila]|nr:hypothetical protein [Legionella pneumophila subsp. fraseri]HAT1796310.1 hypothetical protein [Legionella pneumophila]MDW8961452.1 hypothetical protein [Legionella pneumophila subsp. fraseri]MDW9036271.1 hypothetical protein [Legionella pneumophila subsp. fraseri]MDW9038972.1 hypothetical protein [Legionella pneumophila subsp. fraseri]